MKEARPQHISLPMSTVRGELSVLTQTEVEYSSDLCTVKRAAGTGWTDYSRRRTRGK